MSQYPVAVVFILENVPRKYECERTKLYTKLQTRNELHMLMLIELRMRVRYLRAQVGFYDDSKCTTFVHAFLNNIERENSTNR